MLYVILKSLGTSLIIMAVTLGVFFVGSVFWVRSAVRSKIYCFFLAENKQLDGKLLKSQSNTIVRGRGENAKKYIAHPSREFWSFWPPGFPKIVQEPVPTLFYVEGNAEPLDPWDRKSLISESSLMKISDEAMLKQTWKDVRESVGLRAMKPRTDMIILILVLIAAAAGVVAVYISLSTSRLVGG